MRLRALVGRAMRTLLRLTPRWALLAAGAWALVKASVYSMGGYEKLWLFQRMAANRYMSMALLTGTLRLRGALSKLAFDEQVYNGAVWTNWGFGVPLLQAPFHAAAAHMRSLPQKFFPDRAIYFVYFTVTAAVLWAAFDRLLAMRSRRTDAPRLRRHVLSWSATLLALACTLYPLMASRFLVYEETSCYFVLAELLAVSAYIFALRAWSAPASLLLGLAAGAGLLIRPTGAIYLAAWTMLVAFDTWPRKKPMALFLAALAPLVAFWMYSNWVRSGAPMSTGFINATPSSDYHTPMLRFGSHCTDTPRHTLNFAVRLFRNLFLAIPEDPDEWMAKCHFLLEERLDRPASAATEPFVGTAALALLMWTLTYHLTRRRQRLGPYVPFVGIALVFGAYVYAGAGFAWRYVCDFWPFVVLACVQYVHLLPPVADRILGLRTAVAWMALTVASYERQVLTSADSADTLDAESATTMWDDFSNSRFAMDPPYPSRISCGDTADKPVHNGLGWMDGCGVDLATNVFLGIPWRRDGRYEIRFKTEEMHAKTLRVYVNGRIYTAHKNGDVYSAPFRIPVDSMNSPTVMATVEWEYNPDGVEGKLIWIEIG